MNAMLEKLQQRVSDRDAALEVSTACWCCLSFPEAHPLGYHQQCSPRLTPGVTMSSTCSSWLSLPEESSEGKS